MSIISSSRPKGRFKKASTHMKIASCPNCGSREIKKVRRNLTGKFHGETYLVPTLDYYECPNCGEKVYDRQAMKKIESYSPAFSKKPVARKTA